MSNRKNPIRLFLYFVPLKVDPVASKLNSNDVFVLLNPSDSVLWVGHGASDVEKLGAKLLSSEILRVPVSEVTEGEEGGMAELTRPKYRLCR